MATLTFVRTDVKRRTRSLSLIASRSPSPFLDLPAELILTILELSILGSMKPSVLASVSKTIQHFINIIIYNTVVLDTPKIIALLERTAASYRSTALCHVKRLAITWSPWDCHDKSYINRLQTILSACTGLRVLAVPSLYHASFCAPRLGYDNLHSGLTELVIHSFDHLTCKIRPNGPTNQYTSFSSSVSHLRICEPSDGWYSPLSMITSPEFPFPRLSHLQLSRRTDSNEDNDAIFVDEIGQILRSFNLKMVVVTVFSSTPWLPAELTVPNSHIWNLLVRLRNADERVVLTIGQIDEWKNGWQNYKAYLAEPTKQDFWTLSKERSPI